MQKWRRKKKEEEMETVDFDIQGLRQRKRSVSAVSRSQDYEPDEFLHRLLGQGGRHSRNGRPRQQPPQLKKERRPPS